MKRTILACAICALAGLAGNTADAAHAYVSPVVDDCRYGGCDFGSCDPEWRYVPVRRFFAPRRFVPRTRVVPRRRIGGSLLPIGPRRLSPVRTRPGRVRRVPRAIPGGRRAPFRRP